MDPNNNNVNQNQTQPNINEQLFWNWQHLFSSLDPFTNSSINRTSSKPTPLYPDSHNTTETFDNGNNRIHMYIDASQEAHTPQTIGMNSKVQQPISSSDVLQTDYPSFTNCIDPSLTHQNYGLQSNTEAAKTILGRDRYRSLSHKQKFIVFIKVLLKILERSNDLTMLYRAKTIVNQCTHRNRMGDASFMPLRDAILIRLRRVVGESYWTYAKSVVVGR